MTLRRKLLLYLFAAHAVFLTATFLLYHDQPLWVVSLEAVLLLSLTIGVILVSKVTQPMEYARQFGELLQDRNYAARLHTASGNEMSELVKLFNSMLDTLYQERLKLGEQRGFLERLLEATPSAVLVFDFDDRISLLNASAMALLGITDTTDKMLSDWIAGNANFSEGIDEIGRSRGLSLIRQLDELPVGESRLLNDPEGRRFRAQRGQFFDRGFPRGFLLIEELTAELESSEKSTYEKLVRVLAHEVNNTVAATGSVLESLLFYQSQLSESDGVDFNTAIEAVRRRNTRLGEFIERFTRVVKMPEARPQPTDLKDLVEGIARLYREPYRSRGITVEWRRCDDVGPIAIDSNLMEQALLNIIKNAVEAAQTSKEELQQASGYVSLELAQESERIRLSVIDSGNRLGEVPAGQMFTPFFTTKKGGQGIGLLFVREVLHRHNISYRLAPDTQGETRFDLWLPATQSMPD
jgi:two-component system nitrogen regulation sensor histidine kinase NtrY